MFIISLTYKKPLSEVEQHFVAHMEYVEKYYALGVFLVSGKKVPRTGGVIFAQANNKAEIEKIAKEDPFYIANLIDIKITEFLPSTTIESLSNLKEYC